MSKDRDALLMAIASAWCVPPNENKCMDADLANAIADQVIGLKWLSSVPSETPRKPIAWRWRIVSTDEIPWLYATEKPNNLNDELFWDVEPLFAASVPSATPCSVAELQRLREIEHMAWHVLDGSAEDATTGNISIVPGDDYFKLCELLPEGHP